MFPSSSNRVYCLAVAQVTHKCSPARLPTVQEILSGITIPGSQRVYGPLVAMATAKVLSKLETSEPVAFLPENHYSQFCGYMLSEKSEVLAYCPTEVLPPRMSSTGIYRTTCDCPDACLRDVIREATWSIEYRFSDHPIDSVNMMDYCDYFQAVIDAEFIRVV